MARGTTLFLGALFLALLAPCSGCPDGGSATGPRGLRDVLLITVDTLRHDGTGFSGAGRVRTPATDRLAAAGTVFPFAHAHAVTTLPSHASILTGLHPNEHGVRDNAGYVLDATIPTLPALLRRAGYRTAAFVSAFPLDRRFGLDNGFEVYDDEFRSGTTSTFTPPERAGDETVRRALEWWNAHRGERRFLWVHLFTPHYPYEPREPFASTHAADPYFGEAAQVDAELEPLLATVLDPAAEPTLVVYTSDHGESLGEHGEQTHGLFAYESTLRIPLVVASRDQVPAGVDDAGARHVDIVPTVLDLMGLPTPADLPGRPLFGKRPADHDDGCYFESLSTHLNRGWAPLHGRIEGRIKAIRLPLPELYDLAADPGEIDNLADARGDTLDDMLARLPQDDDPLAARSELNEAMIERLRSLGYASASAPAKPVEYGVDSDPKNLVHYDTRLGEALSALHEGDAPRAVRLLGELIEQQPRMRLAYAELAHVLSASGRVGDAIAVLQRAVGHGIADESMHRNLARALASQDRRDEAWQVLRVHDGSADPETHATLGQLAAMGGRLDEAETFFGKALELDPSFPQARADLGFLLLTQRRLDEALPHLEAAVAVEPDRVRAWNGLGVIRYQREDLPGAVEAWSRVVELAPRLADAHYNLANALERTGDPAGAARELRAFAALASGRDREEALARAERLERGS
jgi:arylsulfatase A-like enzyme/Flp pilus assembly protein TadD